MHTAFIVREHGTRLKNYLLLLSLKKEIVFQKNGIEKIRSICYDDNLSEENQTRTK